MTIKCDMTIDYPFCPSTYEDGCDITATLTQWCVDQGATREDFTPTLIFDRMFEYQTPGGSKYDCMQVSNYGVLQGFHFYGTGLWGAVTYTLDTALTCTSSP